MSASTAAHRRDAPSSVPCAVITVSDTRTLETDRGGSLVVELLEAAGHVVTRREIVQDDPRQLGPLVETLCNDDRVRAILLTGGTGISRRDQTYETLVTLFDKTLPGYGELFRMLSFAEIGPASMLSRAIGGVCRGTVVISMPGSTAAVRLAMERLIVPELAHLVHEAGRPDSGPRNAV